MIWGPGDFDIGLVGGLVAWSWILWWLSRVLIRSAGEAGRENEQRSLLKWFWVGVTIKATIVLVWYLVAGGHEFNPSVADSEGYDQKGWELATSFLSGDFALLSLPPFLQDQYPGFYYWVGLIYAPFGHHHILVSLFNVLLSVWMAVMLFEVSQTLSDPGSAKYTLIYAMMYPQFVSASYLILKDLFVAFLATLGLWAVYVPRRLSIKVIAFLGVLALLGTVRAPLAVIFGALGVIQFWFMAPEMSRARKAVALVLVLLGFAAVGTQLSVGEISPFERGLTTRAEIGELSPLEGIRWTFSWQSASDLGTIIVSSPVSFFRYAVATSIRFFYGPFFLYAQGGPNLHPYDPGETVFRSLLECLSGLFVGLLMPMIAIGWLRCVRERGRETFLLSAWLMAGILMLILVGALVRWRLPFIVVALAFAAMGSSGIREIRGLYWAYFLLYALLIGANATLQQGLLLPKAAGVAFAVLLAWKFLAGRREQVRPWRG